MITNIFILILLVLLAIMEIVILYILRCLSSDIKGIKSINCNVIDQLKQYDDEIRTIIYNSVDKDILECRTKIKDEIFKEFSESIDKCLSGSDFLKWFYNEIHWKVKNEIEKIKPQNTKDIVIRLKQEE